MPPVLDHALRPLFSYLRAVVLPTGVYAASEDWGTGDSALTDSLPGRITRAAGELTALLGHAGPQAPVDAEEELDFLPFDQQLAALRPQG